MPLKIARVTPDSIADKAGISAGEKIISINGNQISDFIGLQYYCSEPILEFLLENGLGEEKKVQLNQDWQAKLGIEPEQYQIRNCYNHCLFCFIDQMPPNLRESLYVKDDDYLFSFVYGNYISLNNLNEQDFHRIVRERISPLYVSVHTTNRILRKKIMGYRRDTSILEQLQYLSQKGISFHTQIVIIPRINDGVELHNSILDLTGKELNTLSIGLVPVGLTKFRDNLYPLNTVTSDQAREITRVSSSLAESTGFCQIYCADELFILAGEKIPPRNYYDDFCQIENGIGMVRALLNNWSRKQTSFMQFLANNSILLVTGKLAEKYLREIAGKANRAAGKDLVEVLAVENEFLGKTVTVSGLLTCQDIVKELQKRDHLPDYIGLSSNMFNTDGYTLDGISKEQIGKLLQRKIVIINELWTDWTLGQ